MEKTQKREQHSNNFGTKKARPFLKTMNCEETILLIRDQSLDELVQDALGRRGIRLKALIDLRNHLGLVYRSSTKEGHIRQLKPVVDFIMAPDTYAAPLSPDVSWRRGRDGAVSPKKNNKKAKVASSSSYDHKLISLRTGFDTDSSDDSGIESMDEEEEEEEEKEEEKEEESLARPAISTAPQITLDVRLQDQNW